MMITHKTDYFGSGVRSSASKRSVIWTATILFLLNLLGYAVFRTYIANDIFGGDVINVAIAKMDSNVLKESSLIDPPSFYAALFQAKDGNKNESPLAFVYDRLSQEGKSALQQMAQGTGAGRDKEKFLLELNRSIIDPNIAWPDPFLKKASPVLLSTLASDRHSYNFVVLASNFPDRIRDHISSPGPWKYDLRSLFQDIPRLCFGYFSINEPTRYSPLTSIYTSSVQMYLQNSPERVAAVIVFTGLLYSTLMLLVFLLAFELIQSIRWALLAVFLFQGAVSTILTSYQLFSLPYLLVPFAMTGAIYAYVCYKTSRNMLWFFLFVFFAIIGPWFREFPGVIPAIVFASEALGFRGTRSKRILWVCVPLLVHSFFPSLLPWFLGLNKGGVYNVLAQGNVKQITNAASLNWHLAGFLFVQFSPLLWILIAIAIARWISEEAFRSKKNGEFGSFLKLRSEYPAFYFNGLWALIVLCFIYSFFWVNRDIAHYAYIKFGILLVGLIAGVALSAFRFNVLLPIYFGLCFAPFLRITMAELHLSFALVPLAIIFSLWLKDLFASRSVMSRKVLRWTLFIFLAICLADHFSNIVSCANVQRRMVSANKTLAEWLKTHVKKHSAIAMNFYNFADVFLYSGYHFDPYETVANCPMGPDRVVEKFQDLQRLFQNSEGLRDVYLLASCHPFLNTSAENYHSHKYVRNPPGKMEKLFVYSYKTDYLYWDPFKYFIPEYFISFLGYMDWSIDFYYHNTSSLFRRKIYTDYVLYKLEDLSHGFTEDAYSAPVLTGEFRGYNIVKLGNVLYGVPQSLGPLDLSLKADRKRKGILVGNDRQEIERLIQVALEKQSHLQEVPRQIRGYGKYNVVYYGNQYYGVPQSLGPLDLAKETDRRRSGIVVGRSVEEVQRVIDKAVTADTPIISAKSFAPVRPPALVLVHKKYNVVRYRELFYVVPQSLGPLDLAKENDQTLPGIFVKNTLMEARRLIDEIAAATPRNLEPPKLVKRYKKYNIVRYEGLFYALPQSLGPLDLAHAEDRSRPGILAGMSLEEAHKMVDEAIVANARNDEEKIDGEEVFDPAGPPILVTDHNGYNIVFYANVFYAVPQSLGPMDLSIEANRVRPEIVTGSTVKKAKRNIDKVLTRKILARLRKAFFSFFRWLNKGWGPL